MENTIEKGYILTDQLYPIDKRMEEHTLAICIEGDTTCQGVLSFTWHKVLGWNMSVSSDSWNLFLQLPELIQFLGNNKDPYLSISEFVVILKGFGYKDFTQRVADADANYKPEAC